VLLGAGRGAAAERKVQMKDLPPAVRTAVEAETKGATVKGLSREVEGGKTFYEAETVVNGKTRDLLFDAAGKLVEVEEELALDAAPAPVRTALSGRGKVLKLESVTKGSIVTYEAQVQKNGKKSEVALDADGKPVKH
jgi:uncharacterized membrane protein YkoI